MQDAGVIDLFAPDDETEPPAPDYAHGGMPSTLPEDDAFAVTLPEDAQPITEPAAAALAFEEMPELGLLSPEEEAERKQKARRRTRGLALCCLVLLFISLFAFLWFAFRVENIEVTGNEQTQSDVVIEKAGVKKGVHMLSLRTRACEDALRMDPYIATADVKRQYPNTVLITVRERKEAAVIVGMNSVAIIDADGYVLSIGERESYAGLVKIYGAGSSGYKVNGHVGDAADYTSRAMVRMIAAIQKSELMDRIESVDIANTLNVTLLTTAGVTVQLGQPEDLDNKLQTLSVIMPELIRLGYSDGTVQITSHGDPVYSPPQSAVEALTEDEEDVDDEESENSAVPSDTGENGGGQTDLQTATQTTPAA